MSQSSNEYHRCFNSARYHKLKKKYTDKLGGKCACCNNTTNLEFDHIDRNNKEFDVSQNILCKAQSEIESELEKCQLLCHSCHVEKSISEGSFSKFGEANPWYKKTGKDMPTSKPIRCINSGKCYDSIRQAATDLNLHESHVADVCRKDRKSTGGLCFEFI